MRPNTTRRDRWQGPAWALLAACACLAFSTPATAQLPPYVSAYTLVPDPPLAGIPTKLVFSGEFPTGCGEVDVDSASLTIHLHATTCADTSTGRWVAPLPLGILSAGMHSVRVTFTLDRPDSAATESPAWITFEVQGSEPPPPPGPPPGGDPPPPPPPPPADPLVTLVATDPYEPTPSHAMALIVGGRAPFGCPVVTSAAVVDTSHLTLTLAPSSPCPGDSASQAWSNRFDLGFQREGYHTMSLAIVLSGGVVDTVVTPVHFLVYNDSTVSAPPPDSLANQLSANRPNPFAQVTRFSVSTDTPQDADVGVFDILGRRVSRVFHGRLPVGTTQLAWNGFRDDGERAVAGVYFYRLEMSGRVVSRRLILLQRR